MRENGGVLKVKMKKEIVLLAKSWKNRGFCVGGVDIGTGEWIRIVSSPELGSPGITEAQMRCEDGRVPGVLDRVLVPLMKRVPSGLHCENWLMACDRPWEYVQTEDQEAFLGQIRSTSLSPLFYTPESSLDADFVNIVPSQDRYSLALARPKEVRIRSDFNGKRKKFKASFSLDGYHYLNVCVTDPDFQDRFGQNDSFILTNPTLVMSLSEPFSPGGGSHKRYYKLIARIF